MNLQTLHIVSCPRRQQRGSTLIEMMVAVALFSIIAGVAFTLMSQQETSAIGLNGQVNLSMSQRSAVAMLQMDLANAGSYYYQATSTSYNVLGVAIQNNWVPSGSTCYTASTNTYGPGCFDQLSIISVDPYYPVLQVSSSTGSTSTGTNYYTSGTSPTLYGVPYTPQMPTSVYPSGSFYAGTISAANAASYYQANQDHVLIVKKDGSAYTIATITGVTNTSSVVTLSIQATKTGGSNSAPTSITSNDLWNVSTCLGGIAPGCTTATPLTDTFTGGDFILKISPVSYQVCAGAGSPTLPYQCSGNDASDPKLIRTVWQNHSSNVTSSMVMDQMIGFKVGASIWNDPNNTTDVVCYSYDSSAYNNPAYTSPATASNPCPTSTKTEPYNYLLVHSIRVSLLARTPPATLKTSANASGTLTYSYQNAFDGGPYQVQGTTLIVNPRNMNTQSY